MDKQRSNIFILPPLRRAVKGRNAANIKMEKTLEIFRKTGFRAKAKIA